MRRTIGTALFGFGVLAAVGCASSATVVQKSPDGSTAVIALKANGDLSEARKAAEKVLGGEVEILGTTQPAMTQGAFDPTNPSAGPKADPNVMHHVFKKKGAGNMAGMPGAPVGAGSGMVGGPGAGMGAGVAPAGFQQPAGAGMGSAGSSFGSQGSGMNPPAVFPNSK